LRIDDESIEDVQKRTNHVCDLYKLAGALKMKTKKNPLEEIEIEKKKKEEESRKVEEIKMLDDIANDPLASLENFTLDEIISVLQNHACDPHVDYNQGGFGSFIANHVTKEKLNRYHMESMVQPKLGVVWEPRIYVTIRKITWMQYLILGLVFPLFLSLYVIILIYSY
jgi:hypothetical protein